METDTSAAETLAKRLQDENDRGRSWRRIAREDYGNKVHFATLNRIAIHGGEWLPKGRNVLIALGLKHRHMEEWSGQKNVRSSIRKMVKDTRKALNDYSR